MIVVPGCPCNGCKKRYIGCHSHCEDWDKYKAKTKLRLENRKFEEKHTVGYEKLVTRLQKAKITDRQRKGGKG